MQRVSRAKAAAAYAVDVAVARVDVAEAHPGREAAVRPFLQTAPAILSSMIKPSSTITGRGSHAIMTRRILANP